MINKWTQVIIWMLLGAVAAIEAYKLYYDGGIENCLSNWRFYGFILVIILSIYMFIKKRNERNAARDNYSK